MKYILDTVDFKEIERFLPLIEGVTSNPTLLKKANMSKEEFLKRMNKYSVKRFVQIKNFEEFERINSKWNKSEYELIFKVPMFYPDGYQLIKQIKNVSSDVKISSTMMYDIVQLNHAIELGCDYSMVYIAKNENQNFINEAIELKNKTKSNIKLVGASFRTKSDVRRAILSGVEYSTITPEVLKKSLNPSQAELEFPTL